MDRDALTNGESEGLWIIALAWQSTVALIPFLLVGLINVDRFGIFVVVISCSYFFIGLSCLLSALLIGLSRSKFEIVNVGNLFLLQGSAPKPVQKIFLASLFFQSLSVVVVAAMRPYSMLAFGVLAPTLVIGLLALWGAKHGKFTSRDDSMH
jgi:hypothetical protein